MKALVSRLEVLICLFAVFCSAQSFASACEIYLLPNEQVIRLPRTLKLSPETVVLIFKNPEHGRLLESLSRLFAFLDDERLAEIGRALNQDQSEADLQALELPFPSNPPWQTDSFNSDLKTDYVRLYRLFNDQLANEDIFLLAYLLKSAPRNLAKQRAEISSTDDHDSRHERLKRVLSDRRFRPVVLHLLQPHQGRSLIWQVRISTGMPINHLNEAKLDSATTALSRNLPLKDNTTYTVLAFLRAVLGIVAEMQFENLSPVVHETSNAVWLGRDAVLTALEWYFGTNMGIDIMVDSITAVFDFVFFEKSLPLSPDRVSTLILEESKRLLLPLKNAAQRAMAERNFIAARAVTAPVSSGSLIPSTSTSFRPIQETAVRPYVRSNDRRNGLREASTINPPAIPTPPVAVQPLALGLRQFTAFEGVQPKPIDELESDTVYPFWFMREDAKRTQQVRFGPRALRWIKSSPVEGRLLLEALHLGRARPSGQDGVKALFVRSRLYNGPVFELKVRRTDVRGILILNSGVWELLDVVKKDALDRTVENIRPLE